MANTAGEESSVEREQPPLDKPTPQKPMTPGQRLAARKAAKAKRKAEQKGTADTAVDEVADEVEKAAAEFTDFWSENQGRILAATAAFLVAAVGVLLWSKQAASGAAAEANALHTGVEAIIAPVDPEGASEGTDTDTPVFESVEGRAKQALESFDSLQKNFPDSRAASWGLLGEGAAHLDLGEHDEALAAYQKALDRFGDQPHVAARALEGAALALEAGDKPDQALAKLDDLAKLEDGSHEDLVAYHKARLHRAKGEDETAKELLKAAYDRLSAPEPGTPARPYLKTQVELSLMELDSSLVDKPSMPAAGPGGGMSQEQLQELIRQLQQKQQQGGP